LYYSGGWKKFEVVWNFLIKTKNLNNTLPLLETVLSKINLNKNRNKFLIEDNVETALISQPSKLFEAL